MTDPHPEQPTESEETPEEAPNQDGPRHHVTNLQSIERQVGEHVLRALDDNSAVAVLTTVAAGVRNDRVVSLPLSREQVEAIRSILEHAQQEADEADQHNAGDGRREGFLGFHTVLEQGAEEDTNE
ncbi:MAG TPA: hypothetical protein QF800_01960 [Phycisphaerales bacterium]|jgi:hypothetical protein|nr:hypothetical protein [Phycisphaerales bacterium]